MKYLWYLVSFMFNFQPFYPIAFFGSLKSDIFESYFPLFVLTFSLNFPLHTLTQNSHRTLQIFEDREIRDVW